MDSVVSLRSAPPHTRRTKHADEAKHAHAHGLVTVSVTGPTTTIATTS